MSQAKSELSEFTLKAVVSGIVLGALFGAANAYLGLKAGLTVSTSIPIAVLSVAVFRLLSKGGGNILEANLAQTIGSASSSLASGTIFTIPALFMWGVAPPMWQVAALAGIGGILGVLAMIPLRRLLIVEADKDLPYPEGRACAEVLKASTVSNASGKWIFIGLALGAAVKLITGALHAIPEEIGISIPFLPNASLALKIAPALLAVGFIIGFRASAVMVSGSLISTIVLFPLITKAYGAGVQAAGASLAMPTAAAIKTQFGLFLGAGAIAAAACLTIIKTAPTMMASLRAIAKGLRRQETAVIERTDRDLPFSVLFGGIALLVLALAFLPGIFGSSLPSYGQWAAALGVIVFGLIFVPVSSRLVGLVGVSSNPTSAMALITLAGTASLFVLLGWRGLDAKVAVLLVGTVVCVAASKAGDISQDLKTGWLVGATPARQQFGQLIAAAVACWVVALVVLAIGHGPEGFGEGGMPAPQARLMKTVIEAVLGESLPWDLLLTGAGFSLVGALAGLPALPLALGLYLPLSTMAAIFLGGLVRKLAEKKDAPTGGVEAGILCASGFVAGEGLAGVFIAGWAFASGAGRYETPPLQLWEGLLGLLALALCALFLFRSTRSKS